MVFYLNIPFLSSITRTTNYTLTVTDAIGCVSTDDVLVDVISVDIPVIELNGSALNVTNVNSAAGYTWQQLNGSTWEDIVPAANGTSYTASANGTYRVKAAIGSCEAYSLSLLAGRPASSNQYGIYLYPNPAVDRLTMDGISVAQSWETMEIINSRGMRVLTRNIKNQASVSINTAAFESGVYTAKLGATDGKTTVFRFIKL